MCHFQQVDMNRTTMAKLPGLFQRDGIFQIRVMIPRHLRVTLGGRTKIVQSLGTADRREAGILGALCRARLLARFSGDHLVEHDPTCSADVPKTPVQQAVPALRSAPGSADSIHIYPAAQQPTARLRDAYERWKCSKPRSADSVNACSRSIDLYEAFTGKPSCWPGCGSCPSTSCS